MCVRSRTQWKSARGPAREVRVEPSSCTVYDVPRVYEQVSRRCVTHVLLHLNRSQHDTHNQFQCQAWINTCPGVPHGLSTALTPQRRCHLAASPSRRLATSRHLIRASQDEALLPARTPLTLPHHQPLGALKVRWCRKRNSSLQPGESADIDTGREAAAHTTALRCSQRRACMHDVKYGYGGRAGWPEKVCGR